MLWVNLGLLSLVAALVIALVSVRFQAASSIGRIFATLGLQLAGVFVVSWFLVEHGQSVANALPLPPETETAVLSQVGRPALASLELIAVAAILGTCAGTAVAAVVAWSRSSWLETMVGLGSLVWIIPTFLIAIFAQDLQASIYNLTGANVSGGYAEASFAQLIWSAGVLAIRPAAYAFRQGTVVINDQAKADFVRTAFSKGLPWRAVVARHIIRPSAANLMRASANSVRLMFGSLPLVEFFFGYQGLGNLLLQSLGVTTGPGSQTPNPALAIAAAVVLASMLAVVEAVTRIATQQLDPRLAEAGA